MSQLRQRETTTEGEPSVGEAPPSSAAVPENEGDPRVPGPPSAAWTLRIPHLSTRAWVGLVLAIGTVVHLSALRTRFLLDDFLHMSMLRGRFVAPRHPLDLYNFVDDTDRSAMIAQGLLPWWSHPALTIKFFRPLSSALVWLDHSLFGASPSVMHVHSLLWWSAMVIGAFALYRRFLGERIARIAVLLFAVAPCHAMPIAWLANRDALISLGLGIPALFVYTRSRETRAPRDVGLAFVLFALAFGGGEYTLSFTAYVLAFELVRVDDSIGRRIVGMLPFVIPCAVYMAVRTALHYGPVGSGYYNDPFRAPNLFAFFAPRRLAILVLQAFAGLDNETITWSHPWWLVLGSAIACVALLGAALRHLLRESDGSLRRTAAWLAVGALLALFPVLAVVPNQRVLGAAMFGFAPLVALLFDGAWFPRVLPPRAGRAELAQAVALGLGFTQLIHGPVTAALLGDHYRDSSVQFADQMESLRAQIPSPDEADAIVVRGTGGALFAPFGMFADGRLPRRYAVLAWTQHVLVIRTDAHGFDMIASSDAGVFPWGEGNLYLDAVWDIEVGETFPGPGFVATITDMVDGRVTSVHFDLEDGWADRLWLNETPKAYFRADLPPEGVGRPYESDR